MSIAPLGHACDLSENEAVASTIEIGLIHQVCTLLKPRHLRTGFLFFVGFELRFVFKCVIQSER